MKKADLDGEDAKSMKNQRLSNRQKGENPKVEIKRLLFILIFDCGEGLYCVGVPYTLRLSREPFRRT